MIPVSTIPESLTFTSTTEETSRTYRLFEDKIQGYVAGANALKQAIYKVLNTEKYEYPIYSFDYGIELNNLIGKDPIYVKLELMRRIQECLLEDERITSVEDFEFTESGDEITCTFTVNSIYGEMIFAKEVTT